MSDKEKLLACFLDLKRAAEGLYLQPAGKSTEIFLHHGRQILGGENGRDRIKETIAISKMINLVKSANGDSAKRKKMADKILTFGIFLKEDLNTDLLNFKNV